MAPTARCVMNGVDVRCCGSTSTTPSHICRRDFATSSSLAMCMASQPRKLRDGWDARSRRSRPGCARRWLACRKSSVNGDQLPNGCPYAKRGARLTLAPRVHVAPDRYSYRFFAASRARSKFRSASFSASCALAVYLSRRASAARAFALAIFSSRVATSFWNCIDCSARF